MTNQLVWWSRLSQTWSKPSCRVAAKPMLATYAAPVSVKNQTSGRRATGVFGSASITFSSPSSGRRRWSRPRGAWRSIGSSSTSSTSHTSQRVKPGTNSAWHRGQSNDLTPSNTGSQRPSRSGRPPHPIIFVRFETGDQADDALRSNELISLSHPRPVFKTGLTRPLIAFGEPERKKSCKFAPITTQ